MKIFLILPALFKTGSRGLLPRFGPYITMSVAAHLRKNSFAVKIFDAFLENASFQNIVLQINKYQPNIIGVAVGEVNRKVPLDISLSLIEYLKINNPKIIIIAFGSKNISYIRRYLEKNDGLDYYIVGDPEETIVDLLKLLNNEKEADDFKMSGLLYKSKEKIIFTGKRILENLDKLEFPAWDLVSLDKYFSTPHRYKNTKFYPLNTSRGCRWDKCVFCQDDDCATKYSPYRVKSPQKVAEEISYVCQRYGCKEIQFGDLHFNVDRNWLLKLESEFKKNKINIRWSCLSRIDMVNPEVLSIMRRMGCWNILFGIESGCEHLLQIVNKGISLKQIENAVQWCKNEGIEVTGSFLVGLPGEKPKDVDDTMNFAIKMGVDYAQIFIAKWSKEHKEFKHMGRFTDQLEFSQYDVCGKVFIPHHYKNLSHLKYIQRKAYLKFYLHPKTIKKHLKKIKTTKDIKRLLSASKILLNFIQNK